jgi:hypothetical protein
LLPFHILWDGIDIWQAVDGAGSIARALDAGETHELRVFPNSNIAGGLGDRRAFLDGTFSFEATTVPEPTSLLLMGLGVVGLLIKAKQRRKQGGGR